MSVRTRKSVTLSSKLAEDVENLTSVDQEIDFSNRLEFLCRSALLLQTYGIAEVKRKFLPHEIEFIYDCLKGMIQTAQVNPTLEVHALVFQYATMNHNNKTSHVDLDNVLDRILELQPVEAFALIGMSKAHWNQKQGE